MKDYFVLKAATAERTKKMARIADFRLIDIGPIVRFAALPIVFLIGQDCVGKTSVLRELSKSESYYIIPKYITRESRAEYEPENRCVSVSVFNQMEKSEKFVVTYRRKGGDGNWKRSGITHESLLEIRDSGKIGVTIVPAAAAAILWQEGLRPLIVSIYADPADLEDYRHKRQRTSHESQNILGICSSEILLPGPLTHFVKNNSGMLSHTVQEVENIIAKNLTLSSRRG